MPHWTITAPETRALGGPVHRVDVRLTYGRLSIVGTAGEPRIEISRVSSTPVEVELTDGTLTVRNEHYPMWPGFLQPLWWWMAGGKRFEADVSIAVPYDTAARAWVAHGAVILSAVRAGADVECVSGRVAALGIDGGLRAKVTSGPIEALGCAGDLAMETVSGEITVADSAAGRIRATTISGALTADLDNPPSHSDILLETVSGEITVRVREDSDLRVRMTATHGRVTSDFPGLAEQRGWGATVHGELGAATGTLVARAVSGNVALLRRPVDAAFAQEDS